MFKDIAQKNKFSAELIEKDYHLTRILHKISERKIKDLVFKGGTCLNKCYLGFYRLSEDLDFVYNQDVKTLSKIKIRKILDKLRRELFEMSEFHMFITCGKVSIGNSEHAQKPQTN